MRRNCKLTSRVQMYNLKFVRVVDACSGIATAPESSAFRVPTTTELGTTVDYYGGTYGKFSGLACWQLW